MVSGLYIRLAARWRSIRTFNVIDDYNREGLRIDVDFSMPSQRVIRSLGQVIVKLITPFNRVLFYNQNKLNS